MSSDSLTGPNSVAGDAVPSLHRSPARPALLSPAARKAIRQRMLLFRTAATDRLAHLTGTPAPDLVRLHREIRDGELPDTLLARGAGLPFTRELPQGPLLYVLVRATRPRRVVETGVGPGYSTAWILAALDANGGGELVSLGPGTPNGRPSLNGHTSVGQFVPPSLRSRWTLALGNTEDRLREILATAAGVDLFFYDNGPSAARARFELRSAWDALSERGILLAHHVDASPAWADFCRLQGLPPQILDPGPPPLGALAVRARGA
jgi:hypothetical protein